MNLAEFIRENGGLDKVITEDAANIKALSRTKTVIVISHRLANITSAELYTAQKNPEEGYSASGEREGGRA